MKINIIMRDWIAMRGSEKPNAHSKTIVAIPCNPYEPKPYERWTLQDCLMYAKKFWPDWNFCQPDGGQTYEDLLKVFQAGLELYGKIDNKMKSVNHKNM